MQDLMPAVNMISKIEIASLTLDSAGCYFLLSAHANCIILTSSSFKSFIDKEGT